jgi:hypothetical protein
MLHYSSGDGIIMPYEKIKGRDMKFIINKAGLILFIAGAGLAAYAAVSILIARKGLPEGACPLIDSRPMVYTALALITLSIIFDYIKGRKDKKNKKDDV